MDSGISAVNDRVREASAFAYRLREEIGNVIVGQRYLIDRLLVGLLANGHVLLEGVPGLAKTTAVKTLARAIRASFQRIQFTPDLLPADLVGTLIYNPRDGVFTTKKGPIFAQIILADEINRAPAKVQSALLEAMQERQVTIGEETFPLDNPFRVTATQNPPDLMLLDVMMPGGLTGLQVCEQVRADPDLAHTRVVLLTARSLAQDRKAGELAGADAYLVKPFSPLELIEITGRLLAESR